MLSFRTGWCGGGPGDSSNTSACLYPRGVSGIVLWWVFFFLMQFIQSLPMYLGWSVNVYTKNYSSPAGTL